MITDELRKKENNERQRISPLSIILAFILISLVITFHINNVLTVNRLVVENNALYKKLEKIKEENENLKNEIEKLSSLQRILPLAEKLGLEYNKEKINYFEIEK